MSSETHIGTIEINHQNKCITGNHEVLIVSETPVFRQAALLKEGDVLLDANSNYCTITSIFKRTPKKAKQTKKEE